MKIAVVGFEASKDGGTERFTYETVKALEADLFATKAETEFHRIPKLRGPDIVSKNVFPLLAQLHVRSSSYDVVVSEGATYLTPSVAIAVTSQAATLALLNRNELFASLSLIRKAYWKLRVLIPYVMERAIYNQNIPVIAISHLLRRELAETYKVRADRIRVVYPGVDLEEFRPDPELRARVRRDLNLSGDVIAFVGSQWGRKGLTHLIEAVKNEPVTLVVAGGKNEHLPDCPKNVRFIGYTRELCELYNAADLFVFPSLFDAFGLVVLEAMACGIPVVVSRLAGAYEIVGDGGVVIDDPRNPEEIREKVLFAMSRAQELGAKGRLIAEDYSWDRMGREIKQITMREAEVRSM